jgi:acyl transferase domain-containing protein
MLSLLASESQVQAAIAPYASQVAIAAFNSPNNVVISGDGDAIDAIGSSLEMQGVKTKKLQVSHAFHSPLMEPMMAEFAALALQVTYNKPQIPLISNVTGKWVADDDITTPEYWVRHIRQPVRFADSMQTLHQEGYEVFLEIGSQAILLGMARQCLPEKMGLWLPSLRPDREDWQQMLESLEQLYVKGVKVDWSGLDRDYVRRKIVLPTYPFQRERYWLNTTNLDDQNRFFSTEPPKNLSNLLYEVEWQPKVCSHSALQTCSVTKSWLIFADQQEISLQLAKQLPGQNVVCILVFPGQKYQQISPEEFIINPENPDEYSQLLATVAANFPDLSKVLHLWSLNVSETQNLTVEKLKAASKQGCATTLYLVQALVKCKFLQPPCLWLLTQGAQPVLHIKNKIPGLAQSPLWGMGRVISLEHPELWGGMLDLDVDTADEQTAAKLIAEIWDADGEDHIALRDGQRYVARLVSKSPTEVQSVQFRPDGTYLMTGGLGFLGLKLARWMVEQGARHLV